MSEITVRNDAIRDLAEKQYREGGKIEIDITALVSEGDDNGAYVAAWVWVDFSGTELDKEAGS